MFPLVQELAAYRIPVAVTCQVLGFSKQALFAWRRNPVSQRDWDNAHLIHAAIDIHANVHDDLVQRELTAERANQLWLTDEGKLYLCAIKDVWSTRIVGYSIDSRMTADLAVAALRNAVALRENAELVRFQDSTASS